MLAWVLQQDANKDGLVLTKIDQFNKIRQCSMNMLKWFPAFERKIIKPIIYVLNNKSTNSAQLKYIIIEPFYDTMVQNDDNNKYVLFWDYLIKNIKKDLGAN